MTTYAAHPFAPAPPNETAPRPDVVLRSSDAPAPTDFYVHKAVLALASPVFADMFSLAQPGPAVATDGNETLPVVYMSERAAILDKALRFIYPHASLFPEGEDRSLYPLDDLRLVPEALVSKYQVDSATPLCKRLLREHLSSTTNADVVGVFVVACGLRWHDIAREAAWASLRLPLREFVTLPPESSRNQPLSSSNPPTALTSSPLLAHLPSSTYHSLLTYHATCASLAANATTSLLWLPSESVPGADCTNWNHPALCPRMGHWTFAGKTLAPATRWFAVTLDWLGERLLKAPLLPFDTQLADAGELLVVAVREIGDCESCRRDGFPVLLEFLRLLRKHVEGELRKVSVACCALACALSLMRSRSISF
ncbi:BTB domain-containing protein [Mycena indigotica]|uniref:BTB domain-containing protein n=1 Tax=Mycena indigotica TaxID=2126181 RepID=A0A8H6S372_9AGAR|nr:BTB domain-containing protein [Mycena indigotica]KAF7292069.1 BTB domain-containing protein [Mycena indigotica]